MVDHTLVGRAHGDDAGNRFVINRLLKSAIDWGKRAIMEVLTLCTWSDIRGNSAVAQ
ncbi:hypothetical protein CFter6_0379 [Collimonas fungivorans]|uniref:Uncharacterized protein n=1 Tax=Collimonas fungivorans TaxID=158899 RepID=A0A127P5I6_9BURK|nr:hypothetical protein CFter6_0379 [Collimonas fungivorans]